jgi:hypothetical protein
MKPTIAFTCRMIAHLASVQWYDKNVIGANVPEKAPGDILVDMEVESDPVNSLDDDMQNCFVVSIEDNRISLNPMRLGEVLHPEKFKAGSMSADVLVTNKIKLNPAKLHRVLRVWPYSLTYDYTERE